jgi:hypothetical protein
MEFQARNEDLKQRNTWRVLSSRAQSRVVLSKSTDVPEEHVVSTFVVEEYARQETSMKQEPATCFMRRRNVHLKRWVAFNSLHGFISQKTELFITAAVRISNATRRNTCLEPTKHAGLAYWEEGVTDLNIWAEEPATLFHSLFLGDS